MDVIQVKQVRDIPRVDVLQKLPKQEPKKKKRKNELAKAEFPCDMCAMVFPMKSLLNRHKKSHEPVKRFQCHLCPRAFVQKTNLKTHIRTHTGEKPFECRICGHSWSHASDTKVHIRTHTGEKPYSCDKCGRPFAHLANCKKHKMICKGEAYVLPKNSPTPNYKKETPAKRPRSSPHLKPPEHQVNIQTNKKRKVEHEISPMLPSWLASDLPKPLEPPTPTGWMLPPAFESTWDMPKLRSRFITRIITRHAFFPDSKASLPRLPESAAAEIDYDEFVKTSIVLPMIQQGDLEGTLHPKGGDLKDQPLPLSIIPPMSPFEFLKQSLEDCGFELMDGLQDGESLRNYAHK